MATGAVASRSRRSRSSLSNIVLAAATTSSKRDSQSGTPPPAIASPSATRPAPPRPDSAVKPRALTAPGSPPRHASTSTATTPVPAHARVPSIQVQQASPSHTLPPIRVQTKLYDDSAPSSPTPGSLSLFDSSLPPVLPIQIPQPGDEAATQQFYRDVVNHLQTISNRSSLPPTPITATQAFFLGTTPGSPASLLGSDPTQFEDAEEDDSDAWTSASYSPYPTGEQFADRAQPMLLPAMFNQAPPLVRPPRAAIRTSSRDNAPGSLGRANSRSQYGSTGDKENVRYSRAPPPIAPRPAGGNKRATLGLAIQSAGVPSYDNSSTGRNSETSRMSIISGAKLMKKKCKSSHLSL